MEPNCENITNITCLYRQINSTQFDLAHLVAGENKFIFSPKESGEYVIKLVAQNNENFESSSDMVNITVGEYGG